MAHIRKVIRVFLASPGDLDNERQLARSLIDQHNEAYAEALGYHVELVGWEDTVSVFGRPQETINKDLDTCELFIGMLWKKWGTPPDKEGKFSSGFEEEFTISIERRKKENTPEINLLFKDVDQEFLKDPGSDLKKVLKFKDELINNKNVLFTNFHDDTEFSNKFRKCIANYISKIKKIEDATNIKDENKTSSHSIQDIDNDNGFISNDAKNCIVDLISKASTNSRDAEISSFDIARFRLMASALYKSGNDRSYLGVHDNNLLYLQEYKSKKNLSKNEYTSLSLSGIFNYDSENTPIWHWLDKGKIDPIIFTFHLDPSIEQNSFKMLIQLNYQVSEKQRGNDVIINWLTDESENKIRAALEYLSYCGRKTDKDIIRNTPQLLERYPVESQKAIVMILIKYSKNDALSQLTDFQFNNIDDRFISTIFSEPDNISSETLIKSLEHKNSKVRTNSINILIKRKNFDVNIARQFLNDNDFDIRLLCLLYLHENNIKFDDSEIKSKLLYNKSSFGLITNEKDHYYKEYQRSILKLIKIEDLLELEKKETIYSIDSLIALAKRGHKPSISKLREHIDDDFLAFYKEKLNNMEMLFKGDTSSSLIESLKKLEVYIRAKHTKQAIGFLCQKKDKNDILRIRSYITRATKECGVYEIDYLSKFGEWNDIKLILEITEKFPNGMSLISKASEPLLNSQHAANAIYNLGHTRLIDLLSYDMSESIKSRVISKIPISKFKSIDNEFIYSKLLNSEYDAVRKISSLKCSQSLNKDRLDLLINDCLSANTFFYNVIHWLDFGKNRKKEEINNATLICIDNLS